MREIKFRAWHKVIKEFLSTDNLYQVALQLNGKVISMEDDGGGDHWACDYDGDIILMQYIGRKDKNGKEIYEGDIDGSDEEGKAFVDYVNGQFGLRDESGEFHSEIDWEYMKIIGNIYENPELL